MLLHRNPHKIFPGTISLGLEYMRSEGTNSYSCLEEEVQCKASVGGLSMFKKIQNL